MRKLVWAIASLLPVVLTASTAAAEPAWCKGATERINASPSDVYKATEPDRAVFWIVGAVCFGDADTKAEMGKIEAARQDWSKKLDMTDDDWADAAEWSSRSDRNAPTFKPTDSKTAWSTWGPIDQYAGILSSTVGDSSRVVDPAYLADAFGEGLTEVGRFGYIEVCLRSRAAAVEMAMCQPDIDAFDRAKFATQLRGDKSRNGFARMAIRIRHAALQPELAKRAEAVKNLKAKDPGYAQMFTLAVSARKDWASKADPKLVALVSSMDDARVTNSRKASEGCMDKTDAAFKGAVASIPAKQYGAIVVDPESGNFLQESLAMLAGTPNGYLAMLSLHLCSNFGGDPDYLARLAGGVLSRWPGFRGPRTATYTAILTAGIQLDDRAAQIEYPGTSRPWIGGGASSSGGGKGEIASVKVKGEKAVIEFAKVKSKEQQCDKGRQTNKVTQIRSDGKLVYEYLCTSWKTVTFNEPPFPPQTVNSRYTAGLKKGMFVSVVEDVVTVAYPKNGATDPAMIGGAPVK